MIHGIAPEDLDWAIASSQSYYSDAIGAELCEVFEIPDALASGLMTTLEAAAAELVINSDASSEARRRVSQKLVRLYKSLEATSVHLKDMVMKLGALFPSRTGSLTPLMEHTIFVVIGLRSLAMLRSCSSAKVLLRMNSAPSYCLVCLSCLMV